MQLIHSKTEVESNDNLMKLLTYLKTDIAKFHFINIGHFEDEIDHGLYFDSSIPVGSGLGSSGALTAAVYERYFQYPKHIEYHTIKTELAAIESYFHGNSSGFDPLISLFKKPILSDNQNFFLLDIDLSGFLNTYTIFLIKSQTKGFTNNLVNNFMERRQNHEFRNRIDNEYIPIINQTIGAVISSDFVSFDNLMSKYSIFQLTHFKAMIPQRMRRYFEYGIESGEYFLKLCGSGGGGYILGFTRDRLKAEPYFNLNHLEYLVV